MGSPSSISSSEALPWGGLFALALILLIDAVALPRLIPWERVAAAIDASHFGEAGVARDRIALARLAQAPPGESRVVVLGSSRTEAGFRPEWLEPSETAPLFFAKLAHPGMWLFAMRSAASQITRYRPDAVVFVLSEFELHYPLELVPFLSAGALGPLRELISSAGPAFAWRERTALYRLLLGSLLQSYRDREPLGRAGLDGLRRFPREDRLRRPDPAAEGWLFGRASPQPVPKALLERLRADWQGHFTPEGAFAATIEIPQLRGLAGGADSELQTALLTRAVGELREAGAAVILVEAPLFPSARLLYDHARLRSGFLSLGRSLADRDGVVFVPLEDGPTYERGDFTDLTHLDRDGAQKLTRVIIAAVRRALDLPAPTD